MADGGKFIKAELNERKGNVGVRQRHREQCRTQEAGQGQPLGFDPAAQDAVSSSCQLEQQGCKR